MTSLDQMTSYDLADYLARRLAPYGPLTRALPFFYRNREREREIRGQIEIGNSTLPHCLRSAGCLSPQSIALF